MGIVGATLAVWREAATETFRGLGRSWLALAALAVLSVALWLLGALMGRLPGVSGGTVSGFVVGMASAFAAGAYLSLLGVVVVHRRTVRLDDLKDALGAHFWDVVSVLFVFWVASLVLGVLRLPFVVLGATLAAYLVFNPAPEAVYQGGSRSLALLGDVGRFMLDNWAEWFLPQAVLAGFLWFLAPDLGLLGHALLFGPWFGFVGALQAVSAAPELGRGLVEAVLLLGGVHVVMVFRGELYRLLSRGGRRARAWRARFRPD